MEGVIGWNACCTSREGGVPVGLYCTVLSRCEMGWDGMDGMYSVRGKNYCWRRGERTLGLDGENGPGGWEVDGANGGCASSRGGGMGFYGGVNSE